MKRLLTVTFFSALLSFLRMCSGFIIAKVIAIYTGPSGMAMLGQVQSVVSILNGVASASSGTGVVRYTAENIDKGFTKCSPWWKASISWAIALCSVIIPISILLSKTIADYVFDNESLYWVVIMASICVPLSTTNTFISSIINGQKQYKKYILLGVISNILSTIIMIYLVFQYNLKGALIAASISSSISGIIMIMACLREPWLRVKYLFGACSYKSKKKIGGYVLMAVTTAVLTPISLISIRYILVANLGWELTGQWQAVWKISEVYLSIITLSISTYYLPQLSSIKSKSLIKKEITKTVRIVMPIVIILACFIYISRDFIISILFTNEFKEARNLFFIQLFGDVVKILSWLYSYTMVSRGKTKWFIYTEVIFSFLFVVLSFIFIKIYGVQGANLAYLINYIIYFIFVYFNLNKVIK